MIGSILKIDLLKGGRSAWLPAMIVFYDAILAFITIMLMYFGMESNQEGYFNTLPYLHQFFIVSSIQILAVFLVVPITGSIINSGDKQRYTLEQMSLIPGASMRYIASRVILLTLVSTLVFLSSLPIIVLSCVYSAISWMKLVRLFAVIILFSFWCSSFVVLFQCIRKKNETLTGMCVQGAFSMLGGLIMISFGSYMKPLFNIILMMFNPVFTYLGYYANITGDIGVMSRWCGRLGVNSADLVFTLLFYKGAALTLVLTGAILVLLSVWTVRRKR